MSSKLAPYAEPMEQDHPVRAFYYGILSGAGWECHEELIELGNITQGVHDENAEAIVRQPLSEWSLFKAEDGKDYVLRRFDSYWGMGNLAWQTIDRLVATGKITPVSVAGHPDRLF